MRLLKNRSLVSSLSQNSVKVVNIHCAVDGSASDGGGGDDWWW